MTNTQTFEAALAQFDAFTKTAKWIETPRAYDDVAAISAAVDEAIEEDRVAERAAIWTAVAKTEDTYRNGLTLTDLCKIDGREG